MPGNLSGAEQTVSPTATTVYTVTAEDANGCKDTETVTITVNDLPEVTVTGDDEICEGESSELTANVVGGTAGFTYLWSNGDTEKNHCRRTRCRHRVHRYRHRR